MHYHSPWEPFLPRYFRHILAHDSPFPFFSLSFLFLFAYDLGHQRPQEIYPLLFRDKKAVTDKTKPKRLKKGSLAEKMQKQLCTWIHLSTMLCVNPSDFFFALLILRDKKEEMFTF